MASFTMSRVYSLAAPKVASVATRRSASASASVQPPRGVRATHTTRDTRSVLTRSAADESPNATVSPSCSIDDPSTCSLADLEMMYIDALWNYYNGGKFTLSDAEYDRLREELNWQGSGFPTLRRYEVAFVEASIAYARGESIVSDAEYEDLKRKVKASGKRDDVTALLLYTKGQQLLDQEQFDRLADEMKKLDIEVGLRGATCTISNTSPELTNDVGTLFKAYAAISTIPIIIGTVPYIGAVLLGKTDVFPATFGLGFAVTFGLALASTLVNYTGLQNGEVLVGQCPCCETEIKQFFGGEEPPASVEYKCLVCGTLSTLDRENKVITTAGGIKAV